MEDLAARLDSGERVRVSVAMARTIPGLRLDKEWNHLPDETILVLAQTPVRRDTIGAPGAVLRLAEEDQPGSNAYGLIYHQQRGLPAVEWRRLTTTAVTAMDEAGGVRDGTVAIDRMGEDDRVYDGILAVDDRGLLGWVAVDAQGALVGLFSFTPLIHLLLDPLSATTFYQEIELPLVADTPYYRGGRPLDLDQALRVEIGPLFFQQSVLDLLPMEFNTAHPAHDYLSPRIGGPVPSGWPAVAPTDEVLFAMAKDEPLGMVVVQSMPDGRRLWVVQLYATRKTTYNSEVVLSWLATVLRVFLFAHRPARISIGPWSGFDVARLPPNFEVVKPDVTSPAMVTIPADAQLVLPPLARSKADLYVLRFGLGPADPVFVWSDPATKYEYAFLDGPASKTWTWPLFSKPTSTVQIQELINLHRREDEPPAPVPMDLELYQVMTTALPGNVPPGYRDRYYRKVVRGIKFDDLTTDRDRPSVQAPRSLAKTARWICRFVVPAGSAVGRFLGATMSGRDQDRFELTDGLVFRHVRTEFLDEHRPTISYQLVEVVAAATPEPTPLQQLFRPAEIEILRRENLRQWFDEDHMLAVGEDGRQGYAVGLTELSGVGEKATYDWIESVKDLSLPEEVVGRAMGREQYRDIFDRFALYEDASDLLVKGDRDLRILFSLFKPVVDGTVFYECRVVDWPEEPVAVGNEIVRYEPTVVWTDPASGVTAERPSSIIVIHVCRRSVGAIPFTASPSNTVFGPFNGSDAVLLAPYITMTVEQVYEQVQLPTGIVTVFVVLTT